MAWIVRLAEEVGSHGAAARLLGVSRQYVSMVAAGEREPSDAMERFARLLLEMPSARKRVARW